MLTTKFFKKKSRSKKGFTLVEALCSVVILAVVCVGVLNAVAFSREMVFSNNNREKASDKAQLVADELLQALDGIDPADSTAMNQLDSKMNAIANSTTGGDAQNNYIGNVVRKDASIGFQTPANASGDMIQYYVVPHTDDTDVTTDIAVTIDGGNGVAKVHNPSIPGWEIKVRVYYKQVGNTGDFKVVDVSAFAPKNSVSS